MIKAATRYYIYGTDAAGVFLKETVATKREAAAQVKKGMIAINCATMEPVNVKVKK